MRFPRATRQDANRRRDFGHASFDFLGYTFRGRLAQGPRGYFTGFNPAISGKAKKAKGQQIRGWHLNRRSSADLSGLADQINPQVRGWINYYGAFYRSELRFLAWRINEHLARWAMQKFKRFRGKYAKAMAVNGHWEIRLGGLVFSGLAATSFPGWWPRVLPAGGG